MWKNLTNEKIGTLRDNELPSSHEPDARRGPQLATVASPVALWPCGPMALWPCGPIAGRLPRWVLLPTEQLLTARPRAVDFNSTKGGNGSQSSKQRPLGQL